MKPKTVETSVQSSIQHDQVGVALLPVCFLPAHWLPTIPAQMNGDQRSVEGANILSDWRRSSSPTGLQCTGETSWSVGFFSNGEPGDQTLWSPEEH